MAGELEIIVKTTDACNARCVYCSAGSDPTGGRKLPLEIAHILCDQAVRLLDDRTFDRVRFLWHGGEPLLLGKSFFRELATFARPSEITHTIQTNLTLLDPEWIDILEPMIGRAGVGTSLDPFDDVRRLAGDSYNERWLRGLELLDKASWRVGCVYVLHRQGLKRAADLYWFFRNLRDNSSLSLRVNPLLVVGRALSTRCAHLAPSPGEYGKFLVDLARIWQSDHRRLILSPIKDVVRNWEGTTGRTSCDLAGRAGCVDAHLGIDAEGNVYNCGRAVDAGGLCFGNVGESPLSACLDHPSRRLLQQREQALLRGRCGSCRYWRLCHGGCPYESHGASEQAHEPTVLCEGFQLFFGWLEQEVKPPPQMAAPEPDAMPVPSPGAGPPVVYSTPAEWAARIDRDRIRIRARSPRDLHVAGRLVEAGKQVTLELPTSLYGRYLEVATAGRVPEVDRLVADEPPGVMDQRVAGHLAASRKPIHIGPDVPGGGTAAVEGLTRAGAAVVLDRLREWEETALSALAEFFLHSPDLEVPIEPFFSTLVYLSPGGGAFSLKSFYEERADRHRYVTEEGEIAVSRAHALAGRYLGSVGDGGRSAERTHGSNAAPPRARLFDLPCAVCEAFKCCRGFWLEPAPDESHCRQWRGIVALLNSQFSIARVPCRRGQ